jgi:hypothetical protein
MPKTVEERLGEAELLICALEEAGVDLQRLYIDTIVMTIGSNQEQGCAVIDSTREIKKRYRSKGGEDISGIIQRLLWLTCPYFC